MSAAEKQQEGAWLNSDSPAQWQLRGNLDFETVPALLTQVQRELSRAASQLEVDLDGIHHSDSAGMALLMEWTRLARGHDVEVHFLRAPQQLRELARLTSLSDLLGMDH